MTATSRCKTCGAAIRWAKTNAGKPIPLDLEPVATGNLVLTSTGIALPLSWELPGGEPRYVSHFATCPDADAHRRSR